MKILVIPDIHQKVAFVQNILNKAEKDVDLTVFLGDYFDDFQDNHYEVEAMAVWLKQNLYKEKRVFLMGNHDVQYRVLPYALYCSGYAQWKHEIIDKHISEVDWKQIKYFHDVGDFWFSHAGIAEQWFSHPVYGLTVDAIKHILQEMETAFEHRDYKKLGPIWASDRFRGGMHRKGGIVWNDKRNSEFIPNVTQFMGHTPVNTPVVDKNEDINARNVFLDTHLAHYCIADTETNIIEIFENEVALSQDPR